MLTVCHRKPHPLDEGSVPMLCAQCDDSARGVCRFCGRGVCATHHAAMPFIITVFGAEPPKSIVVGGTLWCQVCRPQPEPIHMPELA